MNLLPIDRTALIETRRDIHQHPRHRLEHGVGHILVGEVDRGLDAAGQAIEDAGLTDMDDATKLRAGCSIGSGSGRRPSPCFVAISHAEAALTNTSLAGD